MAEIEELDKKYIVVKWEDVFNSAALPTEEYDIFKQCLYRISEYRKKEGKRDNKYLVLNMDDKIDLSVWSPILKKIKEIQASHEVLVHENKSGTSKEYAHDGKPDFVKDIAVALVTAILNATEAKTEA